MTFGGFSLAAESATEKEIFSFKKLLMPGELSEAHAQYEHECSNCHETFREISQQDLCLDCHEDISADMNQNRGFHGLAGEVKAGECKSCHGEHLGRQGDIVNLDKDSFNHIQTGFELTERHLGVSCAGCHLPDTAYRDTPDQCSDCHESADRHLDAFGKECQDCHSPKGWQESRFDHAKTQFLLTGRHRETQCNACHPDEKYAGTPTSCYSCHALNDVHNGVNGRQCSQCHGESNWKDISFDHDRDTDFKLSGSHRQLSCSTCHKSSGFKQKSGSVCVDCHVNDDEHNGRNGKQCDSCHQATTWAELSFDHLRDTGFGLQGAHAELSCESCHRDVSVDSSLGAACVDCHRLDDVHQGQEGDECGKCHNSSAWGEGLRFSHDLTRFPLVGMHAVVSCDSCHSSGMFRDTDSSCYSCHDKDDSHNRSLGTDCATCHNPNDWRLWLFDHDSQTDFELDGAHTDLSCKACHARPAEGSVKQASSCVACHLGDDVHYRRFGRACERCHITDSFKGIRMQ